MSLTVITLKKAPLFLRGDLTKWMQEISPGVYVGNFNSKIRELLWQRVVESVGSGEATMTFTCKNEIGYSFETHNTGRYAVDFDGIPLVFTPTVEEANKEKVGSEIKHGFSNAAKIQRAKKYNSDFKLNCPGIQPYVILDLETTGLDPERDLIIEIGALKIAGSKKEFTCLVNRKIELSDFVKNLTGISEQELRKGKEEGVAIGELLEFIGDATILGYNVNFDIDFINAALNRSGKGRVINKTYDVLKYVKRDKLFLKNYKLETVLKEYGFDVKVPHRALEDVRLIELLVGKLDALNAKLIQKSK